MKAIDVVNRLKEILPSFTDDFSDIKSISSLTRSGGTITATTSSAHNLATGNYVTIRGAKKPITLVSLTRVGNIVTATSSTDHELSDPSLFSLENLPLYVEIAGASTGYNGDFELLSVPTSYTFTFKITTTPTTPAAVAGYLLLEDQAGYNGYKQITVTSATQFTYATSSSTLNSPAQGTIELSSGTRIDYAATAERISDFYSANFNKILNPWMFVVLNAKSIYKNETIASNISSAQNKNESFHYEAQQDFSIYIFLSSKNSVLGGEQSDTARSYEKPILNSIANYIFDSNLVERTYQPCAYVGNEADDYVVAYYVHRFDFLVKGFVQSGDTTSFDNGTPLKIINGTFDKGLIFKPNLR
jgi:hypothetical protein